VNELAIDALATYRLTRLIVDDTILNPLREPFLDRQYDKLFDQNKDPEHTVNLVSLLSCRWCVGMWVGAGVVVARTVFPRQWGPVARALAFSAVAGLLAAHE